MADDIGAGGGMAERPSAIVVGGGIAGLVAARELAIGGLRVTLLEASGILGGKVASHQVAGIELDSGAESFATRNGTVAAFAVELGLGDDIVTPDPAGAWIQRSDGPAVPLPKAGLLGIPGTPLAADVIAVVGLRGALRAQLDSFLGTVGARERTLGGLVRRRMGRAILEQLVAPVTLGVHSRHPDDLELDVVAPGLRKALLGNVSLARAVLELRGVARPGSGINGIDGGIHRMAEVLAEKLPRLGVEVRLDAAVATVETGRVTLRTGEVLEAEHVVLACRPDAPSTAGIVLATLVVDLPELNAAPRGTGLLVAPGSHGIRAKALTHSTAKWPWLATRAGADRHVLRLSYAADVPAEALGEQARADAEKLLGLPIPPSSLVGFDRVAWPASAGVPTAPPGVTVIGEGAAGTGLAAVIAQAKRETESLLKATSP